MLEEILVSGCVLDHCWVDRDGVKVAAVRGQIPVDLVLAQMGSQAAHIPRINMLEARPDFILVVGLAFEEYWIRARD